MASSAAHRFPPTVYLILGMALGIFLGYRVVPGILSGDAPRPPADAAAYEAAQRQLEARVGAAVAALPTVRAARVSILSDVGRLAAVSATVTVTPEGDLGGDEVMRISELVGRQVEGVRTRFVSVFDDEGRLLNAQEQAAAERKAFWTGIAVNVAKILGILAALITLRFMIAAIGRGVNREEPGEGCWPGKSP